MLPPWEVVALRLIAAYLGRVARKCQAGLRLPVGIPYGIDPMGSAHFPNRSDSRRFTAVVRGYRCRNPLRCKPNRLYPPSEASEKPTLRRLALLLLSRVWRSLPAMGAFTL